MIVVECSLRGAFCRHDSRRVEQSFLYPSSSLPLTLSRSSPSSATHKDRSLNFQMTPGTGKRGEHENVFANAHSESVKKNSFYHSEEFPWASS